MELSKTSAARLTLLSAAAAVVCVAAIGSLGYSFRAYWEFEANRCSEEAHLERLRGETLKLTQDISRKRLDVLSMEGKWQEFSRLTNDIECARNDGKAILVEQKVLTAKLMKLKEELMTEESALSATNASLVAASLGLDRLQREIAASKEQQVSLANVEAELANKKIEQSKLEEDITGKQETVQDLESRIAALRGSLDSAKSNLVIWTERADSKEETVRLLKGTAVDIELSVANLSASKKDLEKETGDLSFAQKKLAEHVKELTARLSDLSVRYTSETNRLAEARRQSQKETDDYRVEIYAECRRKVENAQKTVEDATKRAAELSLSASEAHSNLVVWTEHAEIAKEAIRLRNETVASLELDISNLKASKTDLEKETRGLDLAQKKLTEQVEGLNNLLNDLAVKYTGETNRLAEIRRQLQKETDDYREQIDAECQRKTKLADAQQEAAQKTVADAEKKAAGIISAAKMSATFSEQSAQKDREVSEKARESLTEAWIALRRVKLEMEDAEAKKTSANEEKKALDVACQALRTEQKEISGKIERLKLQLVELHRNVLDMKQETESRRMENDGLSKSIQKRREELREAESDLARVIAVQRKALKQLSAQSIPDAKE